MFCIGCSINTTLKSSTNIDSTFGQVYEPNDEGKIIPTEVALKVSTDYPVKENKEIFTYEVVSGDTWMIISNKVLGDPYKWRKIEKLKN